MTQREMIAEHLKIHRTITPLEAMNKYGVMRLSGIIFVLKDEGYNIVTDLIEVKDRFGKKKHVAKYRLIGGKK